LTQPLVATPAQQAIHLFLLRAPPIAWHAGIIRFSLLSINALRRILLMRCDVVAVYQFIEIVLGSGDRLSRIKSSV
jgi:hypothetical protein